MNEVQHFQKQVAEKLRHEIGLEDDNVAISWRAFAGEGRRIYQPSVDIAVGPFAMDTRQCAEEYDAMARDSCKLINEWAGKSRENWHTVIGQRYWANPPDSASSYEDFIGNDTNLNARCFIAIEIENATSRKHWMGSIINAGALGRIGILVAWRQEVLRAAVRMREYFRYLQSVGKPAFDMSGVIILTKEQLKVSLGI